jgi:hypothetical protein
MWEIGWAGAGETEMRRFAYQGVFACQVARLCFCGIILCRSVDGVFQSISPSYVLMWWFDCNRSGKRGISLLSGVAMLMALGRDADGAESGCPAIYDHLQWTCAEAYTLSLMWVESRRVSR